MHQHSTFVRSAHTVFMCFVFIWEQTATCATYSINWLVFITEMKRVYCAVQTGSLYKAVCASYLKGQYGFRSERELETQHSPPSHQLKPQTSRHSRLMVLAITIFSVHRPTDDLCYECDRCACIRGEWLVASAHNPKEFAQWGHSTLNVSMFRSGSSSSTGYRYYQ